MSKRWSLWGNPEIPMQTVGFDGGAYYIQVRGKRVYIATAEIDDLIYQLMRIKRKVEGE